jgi:hypothetical protein
MKLIRLLCVAGLPLALIACAEEEPEIVEEPVVEAPVVAPAPVVVEPAAGAAGTGMEQVVEITPLNDSGVTGQGILTPMGSETQVMVALNAAAGGTTHPGHIHQGTCESPGSVVQPLQPITLDANGSGTMTTTVPVDPNMVMNGQHVILYHGADAYIACGSIPMHQM